MHEFVRLSFAGPQGERRLLAFSGIPQSLLGKIRWQTRHAQGELRSGKECRWVEDQDAVCLPRSLTSLGEPNYHTTDVLMLEGGTLGVCVGDRVKSIERAPGLIHYELTGLP